MSQEVIARAGEIIQEKTGYIGGRYQLVDILYFA